MNRLQQVKSLIDRKQFAAAKKILEDAPEFGTIPSRDFLSFKSPEDKIEDPTLISRDRGRGRASSGIQFLELISLSFSGRELNSVLKFNKIPVYINPAVFSVPNLTNEIKINAISKALGVDSFLTTEIRQKSAAANIAAKKFLEVFEEVKKGTFRVQIANSTSLLATCRVLVRTAINTRKGI